MIANTISEILGRVVGAVESYFDHKAKKLDYDAIHTTLKQERELQEIIIKHSEADSHYINILLGQLSVLREVREAALTRYTRNAE